MPTPPMRPPWSWQSEPLSQLSGHGTLGMSAAGAAVGGVTTRSAGGTMAMVVGSVTARSVGGAMTVTIGGITTVVDGGTEFARADGGRAVVTDRGVTTVPGFVALLAIVVAPLGDLVAEPTEPVVPAGLSFVSGEPGVAAGVVVVATCVRPGCLV